MTYMLTQEQIAEPQVVREGMCLADWERVPGFDWSMLDDPSRLEDLILPLSQTVQIRNIAIERPGDSPNQGGFGQNVPSPCGEVVLHWWGSPSGQSHDGIVAWLKNPASQVSSTAVVSPGRVTQILPWTTPSWANGNSWANANAITLECDPNNIPGTIATVVELLHQLMNDGVLTRTFRLTGHKDWYNTSCPGGYYPRLAEIRQASTTGEDMGHVDTISDDAARKIALAVMGGGGAASVMYTDRLDGHQEYPETALFSLRQRIAGMVGELSGRIDGLSEAIRQVSSGQQIDIEAVNRAASDGARAGVQSIIDSATITLETAK